MFNGTVSFSTSRRKATKIRFLYVEPIRNRKILLEQSGLTFDIPIGADKKEAAANEKSLFATAPIYKNE
ncbi:hypothetical protein, partial [Bacteroides heparinolyticus]|uniref:hypothetical protein n=1 Tax=Prevotella heparinolytica TaxID=28113 RepID=UPI0035A09A53